MTRLNGQPRAPRPCAKCAFVFDTRSCPECAKVRDRARYAANIEQQRARRKAWREANPEYGAEWKRANPDKTRAYTAKWAEANPDKVKAADARRVRKPRTPEQRAVVNARSAAWKKANPERTAQVIREWAQRNPDRRKAANINRRAREAPGRLSPKLASKLFTLQRGKCACCGEPLGKKYHMDHITPLALGGTNTDDNMQLLRDRCNLQKGAKHPVDFMQTRGRLL